MNPTVSVARIVLPGGHASVRSRREKPAPTIAKTGAVCRGCRASRRRKGTPSATHPAQPLMIGTVACARRQSVKTVRTVTTAVKKDTVFKKTRTTCGACTLAQKWAKENACGIARNVTSKREVNALQGLHQAAVRWENVCGGTSSTQSACATAHQTGTASARSAQER
eukprot:1694739-Rhodomonas_salina.1